MPWIVPCWKQRGGEEEIDEQLERNHTGTPSGGHLWHSGIFIIFGLFLILSELPYEWNLPTWYGILINLVFVLIIVVPPIGFTLDWIKGFPCWSYPYGGLMLVFALYLSNAATPGLRFGSYPFFGREFWG